MNKEYKLTTIKDIFDKVPASRILECCNELGTVLTQAKELQEITRGIGDLQGVDGSLVCDEEFTWVDDGEKVLGVTLVGR